MKNELTKYKVLFSSLLFVLTAILIVLFIDIKKEEYIAMEELALEQARASFNKDLVYRKWSAQLGGVYVLINDSLNPNPYLKVEEREITSTSGKTYTLINPAYMTRMVHELAADQYKVRGHITSLKAINPENEPDEWERNTLQRFENGEKEYYSIENEGEKKYLRYMGVMLTEKACLKCHGYQGYKVGDVRGGISVSVPLKQYELVYHSSINNHFLVFGTIYLIIILLIFIAYRVVSKEVKKRALLKQDELEFAKRHHKIIQTALDGFVVVDKKGYIIETNPAYCKMTGYTEEELHLKKLAELDYFENESDVKEHINKVKASGSDRFESIQVKKDGTLIHVEVSTRPDPLDNENLVAFIKNITEKKNAETELKEKEEQYRHLVDNIHDLVCEIDENAVYTFLNDSYINILGYDPDELIGKPVFDLIHPEDQVSVAEKLKKLGKEKEPEEAVFRFKHKNGAYRTIESRGSVYENTEGVKNFVVISRDITEQKSQEEKLKASEKKFRQLFENMNEAFALHKIIKNNNEEVVDYKFIDVNPKFEELTGLKKENLVGKRVLEVMPNTEKHWIERYGQVALTGEPVEFSNYAQELKKHYHVKAYSPEPEFFAVSFSDVTAQKDAEKAILESEERYRQVFESTGTSNAIFDKEFKLVLQNSLSRKNLGVQGDEMISKTVTEVFGEAVGNVVKERMTHVFKTGEGLQFETKFDLPGGTKWFRSGYEPVKKNGEVIAIQTISLDITDRKLAQQALEESEEQFRLAMKASSDGLFDWNLETDEIYYSPAWKKMLGYDEHELKNEFSVWEQLTKPEDVEKSWTMLNELLQKKREKFETEFKMKHKNGSWVDILSRADAVFDENGKAVRVVGTHTDITERNKAKKSLENALAEAKIKQKEITALLQATQLILNAESFEKSARGIFDVLKEMIGAKAGYVAMLSDDGAENEVLFLDAGGKPCTVDPDLPMPIRGLRSLAYHLKDVAYENDFHHSEWVKFMPEGHVKLENVMFSPLLINNKTIGLIGIANKPGGFTERDAEMAKAFGEIASVAFKHVEFKEKLIKSEQRYRTIIESANDAIFIARVSDGVITDVNKKGEELVGLERNEIIGMHQSELHPPEVVDVVKESFQKNSKREEKPVMTETFVQNISGEKIPIEISPAKVTFDDGEEYLIGFFRNIKERKDAEAELIEALQKAAQMDEKHRFLFENMTQGVVYHDSSGKVIYANQAAGDILGLTVDQLKGKTSKDPRWHSICEDGSDYPGEKHPAMITLTTGKVVKNEKMGVYNTKDKTYHWINIHSIPIFNNREKPNQVLVTFEDITTIINTRNELKNAIIRLEESEKKYRDLVETAQELIWKCDAKGKYIYLNKAWENTFGYKVDEMLGKSFCDFQTREDFQRDMSEFTRLMTGGSVRNYETTHFAKDGRKLTLLFNAIHATDDEGNIIGTQGTATDITRRKRYEQELERHRTQLELLVKERTDELQASNEELIATNEKLYRQQKELKQTIKKLNETQAQLVQSEKMASLGVLVAGVAHEINNPINFINSSITGLKNNLKYLLSFTGLYNQLSKDNLKVIDEIIEQQKEVKLSDVLEMFRRSIEIIEVGIERATKIVKSLKSFARTDEKELAKYNVHENIDNTLLILFHQYKDRIEIKKEYDKIPLITCYPGQMNQVLMNILTNAIQAIKEKGFITISTKTIDPSYVSISIKDTGTGIAENNLKHIFDPFYTTKEVGKGTGLGLSISYNIIKQHKGKINVSSKEGKGSCFTVIIPIKQEILI